MTRREEIINNIGYKMTRAALDYVEKHEFADGIDCFEAGAEWMQKKMIEKAELWLLEKGRMYVICESDITDLIHDWRKAMED